MRTRLERVLSVAGTLFSREVAVLTSSIAFNFLLCLFPILLVVVAVAQHLEGSRAAGAVESVLSELIPFGRDAITYTLRGMTRHAQGLEFFSLLLILYGSSGIFMPVEMALNHAWGGRKHRAFWKSRILAFLMTLLGGALALLSISLTVEARKLGRGYPFFTLLGTKGSAAVLTYLLFFLVYRVVPESTVGTFRALLAALSGGTAWEVAKYVFVARLAQLHLQTIYGPLTLSVALVLWAYVSSLCLVFGALLVGPRERLESGEESQGNG
jgi:membrane protein/epoxyqueuosine reductase